jgi:hypothetical protein
MRKWGDGLSAGHLPNSLVSLLKVNGYNHVPLYVGTWGPFGGSAPVWCVQVILYEKELSYDVCVVLSYPVFLCQNQVLVVCMTQDQWFHTYGPKVFADNQMPRIKYNYYISNVSKDYDDSQ